MISVIYVVNTSDVLTPPLIFINVTAICDQGARERVFYYFVYRELLL